MVEDSKRTVIEKGTEVDGTIKSERPIVLSGSMKGQVTAPSLEVMQSGKMEGSVKVSQFSCKGEISGEVVAEAVELSGRVCDATVIRAKTLDVKLAQSEGGVEVSFGNCDLQIGDLPARPNIKVGASTSESSKAAPAPEKASTDIVDAVSELIK